MTGGVDWNTTGKGEVKYVSAILDKGVIDLKMGLDTNSETASTTSREMKMIPVQRLLRKLILKKN